MVDDFPIFLFFVHPVRQGIVTNQLIYDGLKDMIETWYQQILFFLCTDKHLSSFIKESVTQIPQFQCFVGKVLVFYLTKAGTAISIEVSFKLCAFNKLKLAFDFLWKAVSVADEVQNGEENNQQFLIEVYLPFFVNGFQINGLFVLYDGRFTADCACPVYLVEAGMQVLYDEEEEILVILVEL